MNSEAVWYVAFGSNLALERFSVYLTGGPIPFSTTGRHQVGARDPSPPTGDQPFTLERSLLFTGSSPQWGDGGTAAIDHDHNPVTPTLGRAYRITLGQFEDVLAQENRLDVPVALDLGALLARPLDVVDRKYGRAELIGDIEGEPAVTLASPVRPTGLAPADASYLRVMARGLGQAWDMDARAAADYLSSRPGNAGRYDPAALAEQLI